MITINTIKPHLTEFDIDELTSIKYRQNQTNKEFNFALFVYLDYLNKHNNLNLDLGLMGDNIDYLNIYYAF